MHSLIIQIPSLKDASLAIPVFQPLAVMEPDALLMPSVLPVPPTVASEDSFCLGSGLEEPVPRA